MWAVPFHHSQRWYSDAYKRRGVAALHTGIRKRPVHDTTGIVVEKLSADNLEAVIDIYSAHSGVMTHDAYSLEQALTDLWSDPESATLVARLDGDVAGFVRLFNFRYKGPNIHCMEAGTAFDERFWGDGRITVVCKDVIAYVFETVGIFRLEARTMQSNKRARAFIERLGFKLEANLRGRLSVKGQPRTECVYSIIRPEYFNTRR